MKNIFGSLVLTAVIAVASRSAAGAVDPADPAELTALAAQLDAAETSEASADDTLNRVESWVRKGPRENIPPLIVDFSTDRPGRHEALAEDLTIMTHLFQKTLEHSAGAASPAVKMGIPLLLTSGGRSVRAMYLEGFGALFTLKVGFPLLPPPKPDEKKAEPGASTEWDKARREVFSPDRKARDSFFEPEANVVFKKSDIKYDADLVEKLKKELTLSLQHATNIRHLNANEFVALAVFGGPGSDRVKTTRLESNRSNGRSSSANEDFVVAPPTVAPDPTPGTDAGGGASTAGIAGGTGTEGGSQTKRGNSRKPSATPSASGNSISSSVRESISVNVSPVGKNAGLGSVLTLRVLKADVDAFAKGAMDYDHFLKKVTINTYVGSGYDSLSLNSWTRGSYQAK